MRPRHVIGGPLLEWKSSVFLLFRFHFGRLGGNDRPRRRENPRLFHAVQPVPVLGTEIENENLS